MQVISRKVCDKKEHAEIPSWVPLEVRELLKMCFTYNPSQRPGAAEILEELNNVCTPPSLVQSSCTSCLLCASSWSSAWRRLHLCLPVVYLHLAQNIYHSAEYSEAHCRAWVSVGATDDWVQVMGGELTPEEATADVVDRHEGHAMFSYNTQASSTITTSVCDSDSSSLSG